MFHSTHLNTYAETINQAVDNLAVNLDKIAEAGEEVDIFRQLGRMTMQVIGAAAFGCAPSFSCTSVLMSECYFVPTKHALLQNSFSMLLHVAHRGCAAIRAQDEKSD